MAPSLRAPPCQIGWSLIYLRGGSDVFGWNHDYEYVGLTPGLTPAAGSGEVRRVSGSKEWSGEPTVQFAPPKGVSAAMAGTVVDGKVDPADIGAMMIDLSLRGWFRIEKDPSAATGATPTAPPPREMRPARVKRPQADEWVFIQNDFPRDDVISQVEADFLNALFPPGISRVGLAQMKRQLRGPLRLISEGMYRETVARGWYERDPRSRGFLGLAGRAPRTADGTAVRIQTLGFRKYLATAEAKQIKFEEAADLFNRYLPYAMVFGLAERWAGVIGEVARQAQLAGVGNIMGSIASDPFFWMFYGDDLVFLGAEAVGGVADLLGGADGLFDLGGMTDGLGDVFGSIGDVVGDIFDF